MFIYRFLYPIHALLFTVRSILLHRKGELYYGCCCLVLLRWKFCLLLTKAYDMSATQFAIAVSERIGRTITASDVAQAIRQKEVDAMMRRASQAIYIPG